MSLVMNQTDSLFQTPMDNQRPIDCLLVLVNLPRFDPYYINYVQMFKKSGKRLCVLFWNRTDKPYEGDLTDYVEYRRPAHENMLFRQTDFRAYARFVLKFIHQHDIKNVIFATISLMMAIPRRELKPLNYILDYRDVTFEKIPMVRRKANFVESHSAFTFISSEGFRHIFDDQSKLVLTHNVTWESFRLLSKETILANCPKEKAKEPYTIVFYGFLREKEYWEHNVALFANDPRFVLKIYGTLFTGGRIAFVDDIIRKSGAKNITYYGPYTPEEQVLFVKEANAFLYNYPPLNDTNISAVANKYYDAIRFGRPLIGDAATYSGKRLAERGLGLAIDWDDQKAGDKIANYLSKDHSNFGEALMKEKSAINADLVNDENHLQDFIDHLK